jgi:hypothetical protein
VGDRREAGAIQRLNEQDRSLSPLSNEVACRTAEIDKICTALTRPDPVLYQTASYWLLDVKVVRCSLERHRYRWRVLDRDGRLVGAASHSYATEPEAFRAGNAAARAIRKAIRVPAARH